MKKKCKSGELLYKVFCLSKTFLIKRVTLFVLLFSVIQVMAVSSNLENTDLSLNANDVAIENILNETVNVSTDLQPQETVVTGTILDEDGNPLPGVNIFIKGTTTGTITNVDGNYSLQVDDPDAILVFSFIGYANQEIAVANQTTIDVSLVQSFSKLDEVILIGYGTQRKADLTGSIAKVNIEDVETVANVNVFTALKGKTAGVNVGGEGLAGDVPDLSIRGKTSLSATDAPLLVLDGIIYYGSIADLNVNDVESIDILKDASAAAVYGSRSANGVMLITTKKGKTEKPVFSFNAYYGAQGYTNSPERVMDGDEFAIRLVDFYWQQDLYNWYATNPTSDAGKPVRPNVSDRNVVAATIRTEEERINYLAGREVDWMKEVEQSAPIQNYDLSVSGRTDMTNYYVSVSSTDQKGRLLNDQFKRNTIHTRLENKINDWLTIGLNASYSSRDYSGVAASFSAAMNASPLVNITTDQGDYPQELAKETSHPLQHTVCDNEDIRENLFGLGYVKIQVPKIKGLNYEFNYANTRYSRKNSTYYPSTTQTGNAAGGDARKDHDENISWILNNILSYSRTFADDHSINGTLLYSREKRTGDNSRLRASGFDNELLGYNSMELGSIPLVYTDAWEENSLSYMARLNYSFKNRYLITGTIRKDGFSGFGANKKTATFPSLSLGWVISEESFLENLTVVDFLKLRMSVGENGNQGIGRYSSFSKMGTTSYIYGSTTAIGIYPNSLGNADLGWESTLSYNLGIDFGVLDSRISGTIDVYKSTTSDVLVNRGLPGSTGYDDVWTNLSEIANKGIELSLNSVNIDREFVWSTGFIFALNRDEITKLYGGGEDKDIGNSWFVGEPISAIYNYSSDYSIWTEQEFYNGEIKLPGTYPGHFKIDDLNGDDDIDPNNDRKVIGYETPSYRFSISNNLSYKNFSLYIFINSIQGGNGYYLRDNARAILSCPNLPGSADAGIQYIYRRNLVATRQYWTPDNGVTDAPALYNLPRREMEMYQDRSFVRLQDVSLSYNFSKNLLNSLGVADLQVYVSGKNLYTFTKWEGWDPEMPSDYTRMMRSVITGIRLTF